MKSIVGIASAIIVLLFSLPLSAQDTVLKRIQVDPISAERSDVFVGTGKLVQVKFINESAGRDVKAFPEPHITVLNIPTGTECTIDGGVWLRDSVFLCSDEKVLMVHEFSGSNDSLNFYDTKTCGKVQGVDISDAKWRLDGSRIIVEKVTPGKANRVRKISLKKLCSPGTVQK